MPRVLIRVHRLVAGREQPEGVRPDEQSASRRVLRDTQERRDEVDAGAEPSVSLRGSPPVESREWMSLGSTNVSSSVCAMLPALATSRRARTPGNVSAQTRAVPCRVPVEEREEVVGRATEVCDGDGCVLRVGPAAMYLDGAGLGACDSAQGKRTACTGTSNGGALSALESRSRRRAERLAHAGRAGRLDDLRGEKAGVFVAISADVVNVSGVAASVGCSCV